MCIFEKAITHLKAGHAAARAGWQQYILLDDESDEGFELREPHHQPQYYRPTPEDIRADDWVFFRREDADKITARPVVHT